jgi:type III secretion system YscD/HrpQ family protein
MPRHLIAEEGPLSGLILNLEEGDQWIIGRDPDQVNLVLSDRTISRKHAILKKTDAGISIEDLSSTNPIFINDENIEKGQILHEGDHVKIGDNIFIYSEEEIPDLEQKEEPVKKDNAIFDTIFEEEETPTQKDDKAYDTIFEEEEIPNLEQKKEPVKKDDKAYDTIFEESESEELPFDLMSEYTFILKVISGPNSGAEFGMEKGKTYVIGKDPDTCDIIFNDLSVSREHARMSIDIDGNITIEDLDSRNKTLINNKPTEEKTAVTSQDLISLGTTTFLIINKELESETIYSPLPDYQEPKETIEEEEKKDVKTQWKSQIIPKNHLIIAASFVLVVFVIFISFFSLFKGKNIPLVVKDDTEAIGEIVSKYDDVKFSFNPKGENLFLTGHVLTEIDHAELLYYLRQLQNISKINDNIVIDELVWKSINDVLNDNDNWRGITIYSPKAGQFIMQGYIKTPQELETLNDYINVNFPYTDRLENKVVVELILQAQISSIIISNGFDGITFQLNNGELILTGRYNEANSQQYEKMIVEIENLPSIRNINNVAVGATEQSARIDLSQKYKITGFAKHNNKNISIVANGQIISQNATLDGMLITKILPETILLEKEGLKYKINYIP